MCRLCRMRNGYVACAELRAGMKRPWSGSPSAQSPARPRRVWPSGSPTPKMSSDLSYIVDSLALAPFNLSLTLLSFTWVSRGAVESGWGDAGAVCRLGAGRTKAACRCPPPAPPQREIAPGAAAAAQRCVQHHQPQAPGATEPAVDGEALAKPAHFARPLPPTESGCLQGNPRPDSRSVNRVPEDHQVPAKCPGPVSLRAATSAVVDTVASQATARTPAKLVPLTFVVPSQAVLPPACGFGRPRDAVPDPALGGAAAAAPGEARLRGLLPLLP